MAVKVLPAERVAATEARKNWFRLLDEVAGGEVVLIERDGARLRLALAEPAEPSAKIPDYRGLIHVPDADSADQWSWEWDGSAEGLRPHSSVRRVPLCTTDRNLRDNHPLIAG